MWGGGVLSLGIDSRMTDELGWKFHSPGGGKGAREGGRRAAFGVILCFFYILPLNAKNRSIDNAIKRMGHAFLSRSASLPRQRDLRLIQETMHNSPPCNTYD